MSPVHSLSGLWLAALQQACHLAETHLNLAGGGAIAVVFEVLLAARVALRAVVIRRRREQHLPGARGHMP